MPAHRIPLQNDVGVNVGIKTENLNNLKNNKVVNKLQVTKLRITSKRNH